MPLGAYDNPREAVVSSPEQRLRNAGAVSEWSDGSFGSRNVVVLLPDTGVQFLDTKDHNPSREDNRWG